MVIVFYNDINKSKSNICRWLRNFKLLKNIFLIDYWFLLVIVFKWNIVFILDIILNLDKRNLFICFNVLRFCIKCYIGDMFFDVECGVDWCVYVINVSLNNFIIKFVWVYVDCIVLK